MFNNLITRYYVDNVELNPGAGGKTIATEDIGGIQHELVIVEFDDGAGGATKVSSLTPLPVTATINPAGLATSAKQDTGNTSLASIDSKLTSPLSVTGSTVAVGASVLPTGAATAANQQTDALTNTQLRATPVPISGTVVVDTSLLATAAKQDTGNTSLASIKTNTDKIPSQGQALMAASTPVVIASNQSAVPISAAALPLPSGAATAAAQTDKSQFTKLTDGTDTALITAAGEQNVLATAQPGVDIGDVTVNNVGQQLMAASIPVVIASNQSAVPISGTVTVDTSLLATAVKQDTGNTSLSSIDTKLTSQATAAKQDAQTALLTTIDAGIPAALGQTTMAASMPVVIASNQSAIPVSFSGSPAIDNTTLYSNTLAVIGAISGIDTTGYTSIVFGFSGVWVGNLIVEGSADNSVWEQLIVIDVNEIAMQDVINENGVFQIKATSKYVRINVQQVSGTITALIVGRTVAGINAADSIAFAMDRSFNMPLYVSEIDSKKDISKALIPSDAPAPIFGNVNIANAVAFQVDTTGYNSIMVQCVAFGSSVTVQSSNDGIVWEALLGYRGATAAATSSVSTVGIYEFPVVGKFVRGLGTGSSLTSVLIYLRQKQINPFNASLGGGVNVVGVGGNSIISAGLSGVVPVAGPTANAVAPTANPNLIAGIDTSGLTRRIFTDTTGRIIGAATDASNTTRPIGTVTPSASNQNVASLTVQETSIFEGQSFMELLAQLLVEMKINNQYLYDLPLQLQKVFATLNNSNNIITYPFPTEPNEMRNDQTLFAV